MANTGKCRWTAGYGFDFSVLKRVYKSRESVLNINRVLPAQLI